MGWTHSTIWRGLSVQALQFSRNHTWSIAHDQLISLGSSFAAAAVIAGGALDEEGDAIDEKASGTGSS